MRSGQLLATIDVPDLDKELEQAKATLAQSQDVMKQAKYNYDLQQEHIKDGKILEKEGHYHNRILNSMKMIFM